MAPPVAGYVRWWDASLTGSITQSGGFVSQWNDQSATADHVTQAVGGNQPVTNVDTINGLNVIKFDGADDFLQGGNHAVAQPATIFAVGASTDITAQHYIVDGSSAEQILGGAATGWLVYAGTQIQGGTFATGTHILSAVLNGASSQLWVDGTSVVSGNAGAGTLNNFSPGGLLGPWQGDIAEIIVYPSGLNTTDRQSVEAYLTAKWVPAPVIPPDAGPLQIAPPPGFLSPVATLRFPMLVGDDEIHTGVTVTFDGHGDLVLGGGSNDLQALMDLRGHGDLALASTADLLLLADLAGHGDIAFAASSDLLALLDLSGHGDLSFAAAANLLATMDLSGHGDISFGSTADLLALLSLAGHGDIVFATQADLLAALDLAGHGDLSLAATADLLAALDLSGHADLAFAANADILLLATLAGHGDIALASGLASLTVTGTTPTVTARLLRVGKRKGVTWKHGIQRVNLGPGKEPL